MDRVTAEWQAPRGPGRADRRQRCRRPDRDAYYQLVCYQVKATANLYALRQAEFTNILYAGAGPRRDQRPGRRSPRPGSPTTRRWPTYYNNDAGRREVEGLPDPAAHRLRRRGPVRPERALAAAGARTTWRCPTRSSRRSSGSRCRRRPRWAWPSTARTPGGRSAAPAVLPAFSPYQSQPAQYIEVFNRGHDAVRLPDHAGGAVAARHDRAGRVDKQVRATRPGRLATRAEGHAPPCRSPSPAPEGAAVVVQAVDRQPA